MDPTKEALGRIVIAEFESRRRAERAKVRASRVRFAVEMGWIVAVIVFCVLVHQRRLDFPESDWLFLGGAYVVSVRQAAYRTREDLAALRDEIENLKKVGVGKTA